MRGGYPLALPLISLSYKRLGVSLIRRKTVFVVGAGASHELGFPLGEQLLDEISKSLNYVAGQFSSVEGGSQEIWQAASMEARHNSKNTNDYLKAALRVRDAAHLGLSIDNVIHQQFSDELLVLMAKLGISYNLLKAEDSSYLKNNNNGRQITWPKVRGTWLGRFAQLLVQDVEKSSIYSIFDNVSVISFNYDRTIRRFMPMVLSSQFSIPESDCFEIAKKLKIFYPYGYLGPLEWESSQGHVPYGSNSHHSLFDISNNIRTFTERLDNSEELSEMRSELSAAYRIVFLGFGYLSQNMLLISEGVEGRAAEVMGTSFLLSESDTDIVSSQLRNFFSRSRRIDKNPTLMDMKCEEFLRKNFRTITSY